MKHKGRQRRATGFSLIELLVVVGIIILVLAIAFPFYQKLGRDNAKMHAMNAITMQLAAARATALATQRQAGLLFYEDPKDTNQTMMVHIQAITNTSDSSSLPCTLFGTVPNQPPIPLPRFIRVATPNLLGAAATAGAQASTPNLVVEDAANAAARLRVVLFNERGQLLIRNGIAGYNLDVSTDARAARSCWNVGSASSSTALFGSTAGLVVYDYNEYMDATRNAGATEDDRIRARSSWLMQYADPIGINHVTGMVIR